MSRPVSPSVARRRRRTLAVVLTVLLVGAVVVLFRSLGHEHGSPAAQPAAQPAARPAARPATTPAPTTALHPRPTSSPTATATSTAAAVRKLTADLGSSGVSVAAEDLSTHRSFSYGAPGGIARASIAKLSIFEVLMLQKQRTGQGLTDTEEDAAERMIENSDNDAANTLAGEVGWHTGLTAGEAALGLHCTVEATDDSWGLSTTCAQDQLTLLDNLVRTGGPLTASSQRTILGMMREVESDQRWGVGVVADPGTTFANKNGWLPLDDDNDLWLVNSLGVLTVHGHTVLMAVLTQHNPSFQDGVELTEAIARTVAPAVTG